jgi:hypothetical protein
MRGDIPQGDFPLKGDRDLRGASPRPKPIKKSAAHAQMAPAIVAPPGRGAAPGGLSWHFARPPVIGLDYEMDVRGAARELVI